jgi:glycosyltransferase involved in cell wall biosynthesis
MVDGIICHSDNISTRLQTEFAVPEEKIGVIPHGPFFYDLPATNSEQTLRSFNLQPGKLLVLWQGIIFPYKGIDLLLNAWQHVETSNENVSLLIVGTGAPEFAEQIRDQINRLGLKHAQLYLRFISTEELVALYRASDIVVYPYRAITTSGALATGLALGKTIIASDLPVFRELLTDRENALLVDPNNSAQVAAALVELANDPQLRSQLAANVLAMHFGDDSWLSIANRTNDFYRATLR